MIGYTVNAKVKRFIKSYCNDREVLVTRDFLNALDQEIQRVVTISAEKNRQTMLVFPVVETPKEAVKERLICDVRIKQRVREINKDMVTTKSFLVAINSYVAAVIKASIQLLTGVKLTQLVTGDAVAKHIDEKRSITPPMKKTPVKKCTIEPSLPREHIQVRYTVTVQQAVLQCAMNIYTAKTTERIERAVKVATQRYFTLLGITDPIEITLFKIERKKNLNEK